MTWLQYIGALQKKHSCGSFELLSKTAPIQAASLIVVGPFVDYFLVGENLANYTYTSGAIVSHDLLWYIVVMFSFSPTDLAK